LGTESWRKERAESDIVREQSAGEGSGQFLTGFVIWFLERRGYIVTVFGHRLLEI